MHHVLLLQGSPRDVGGVARSPSPEDVLRAGRFRRELDRDRSLVAAALLRCAVDHLAPRGVPGIGRWCRTCGTLGDHGRPVALGHDGLPVPDLHLSAAHAGEVVLVAATRAGPVGIDVEVAGNPAVRDLEETVLTPRERASEIPRVRIWTRKEAVLKATGHGLALDPTELDTADWPRSLGWGDSLEDDLGSGVHLLDLDTAAGHVASLCLLAPVSEGVRLRSPG